jgi:hypothetical protein
MNGKKYPKNSFEKFTAKTLVNKMKQMKDPLLQNYAVTVSDRQYNICQRDPLAVQLTIKSNGFSKASIHACPTS